VSTLFLCGAGNSEGVRLALAVERHTHRWDRILLLDDDPAKIGRRLLGVAIVGAAEVLADADKVRDQAVNLVTRTCERRDRFQQRLDAFGVPFASLIHPAVDTLGATLAPDVTVYGGATIGSEASIGSHSVVFMGAVIGHESSVASGCVVAANAVLNARVELGDRVYVGANATLIPEVHVGAGATIGAGSAVLQDVPAGATALGVPADMFLVHEPGTGAEHRAAATAASFVDVDVYQAIAHAWQEVLSRDQVRGDENFFDVGGTSLLAARVAEKARVATGRAVGLLEMFRFPTVRRLAEHLSSSSGPPQLAAASRRAEQRRVFHGTRRDLLSYADPA
jgi:sugar O-acyltransferase (sialic acid O-acetyltransferase NeuD family)